MKNRLLTSLVLLLLILFTATQLTAERKGAIELETIGTEGVIATFELDGSQEEVWKLITDYKSAHTFMPNIKSMELLNSNGIIKTFKTTVQSGLFCISYISKITEHTSRKKLTWCQIKGPFSTNKGEWILTPISKDKTKVVYTAHLNHPLMPNKIKTKLLKKSIPKLYTALQEKLK